jgi:hypothetical protein
MSSQMSSTFSGDIALVCGPASKACFLTSCGHSGPQSVGTPSDANWCKVSHMDTGNTRLAKSCGCINDLPFDVPVLLCHSGGIVSNASLVRNDSANGSMVETPPFSVGATGLSLATPTFRTSPFFCGGNWVVPRLSLATPTFRTSPFSVGATGLSLAAPTRFRPPPFSVGATGLSLATPTLQTPPLTV